MRVLVCGGRDYSDKEKVFQILDGLYPKMSSLMCGGAKGADTLALDWGWSRNFPCERYMANWKDHGKAAGPIRNQRMLENGKPDLVIAFEGGRGTQDMINRAKSAGVKVMEIKGEVK